MKSNLFRSALVILVLSTSSKLHAVDIMYTFNGSDNGLSVISKTVGGVNLTLLNPSLRTAFRADSDGLAVGNQSSFISNAPLTSFQLQVTGGTITLKSYTVGFSNSPSATFAMSGGSGSSAGNPLNGDGAFNANGNWTLAPGQTGTLTASGFTGDNMAQFTSFTFTVVPEPSTYALGLAAAGVMAFAARRRKPRVV